MSRGYSYIAVTILALLLLGSAGVLHFGMPMQEGASVAPCPVMGDGAICVMNPLEHIVAWQSASAATFQNERNIALFLLAFAVVLAAVLWRSLYTKRTLRALRIWHYRLREEVRIIKPLQEAFSNGILNPKVF